MNKRHKELEKLYAVKTSDQTIKDWEESELTGMALEELDAIKILNDVGKRVLAAEGKSVVPERIKIHQAYFRDKCLCEKCVGNRRYNDAIDEMAIRLASVGEGILPEKRSCDKCNNSGIGEELCSCYAVNACIDQTKINMAANQKKRDKSRVWCPKCFDELECKRVLDKKGMIIKHEYYCFGCDKTFVLTAAREKSIKDELIFRFRDPDCEKDCVCETCEDIKIILKLVNGGGEK